jgi:hypothetical protein
MISAPVTAAQDVDAGHVVFTVDKAAEPGDVLPALANLLVGLERGRRQVDQAAANGQGGQAE